MPTSCQLLNFNYLSLNFNLQLTLNCNVLQPGRPSALPTKTPTASECSISLLTATATRSSRWAGRAEGCEEVRQNGW